MITVGEVSANHDGSIERALELIRQASIGGFTAVKFQTYTADEMTRRGLYEIPDGLWKGYDLYDLYEKGSTPRAWHKDLFSYAKECNIHAFSSVFHPYGVEFLEQFDPWMYKIASFEITYKDLLAEVARTGRPVVISTGLSSVKDIESALNVLVQNKCSDIYILKCTSAYPAAHTQLNLQTIMDFKQRFGNIAHIGYSDHTIGTTAAVVAATLGAELIEKHITLLSSDSSLDAAFSLPARDFREFTSAIKNAKDSLGRVSYELSEEEKNNLIYRRSIHEVDGRELILRPANGKPID